jgi:hypothetical protein
MAAVRKRIEERGDAADKAEHFSPYTLTVGSTQPRAIPPTTECFD